jgi:hypothetical protein
MHSRAWYRDNLHEHTFRTGVAALAFALKRREKQKGWTPLSTLAYRDPYLICSVLPSYFTEPLF